MKCGIIDSNLLRWIIQTTLMALDTHKLHNIVGINLYLWIMSIDWNLMSDIDMKYTKRVHKQ